MNGRTNSNGVGTDTLQVPLDPPVNLTATAGNAKVSLTWEDPVDKYATPEGETAQDPQQLVSEWDYTVVVRKVGSQPNDPNDGTVVTKSSIRNQYQTSPYEDTGLINDTVYFYGVFAVNKDGVASDGDFTFAVPPGGTPISQLSMGTIIYINENGAPTEYMIVHHGLPDSMYDTSCNGTWLLRKTLLDEMKFDEYHSNQKPFGTSDIFDWLNNDFISSFTADIQNTIRTVKIPYLIAHDEGYNVQTGTNGLECKIFFPSINEYGYDSSIFNLYQDEGKKLDYFELGDSDTARRKRTAYYNGSAEAYWTRSKYGQSSGIVITFSGTDDGTILIDTPMYVRPAFIVSSDSIIDVNMNLIPD